MSWFRKEKPLLERINDLTSKAGDIHAQIKKLPLTREAVALEHEKRIQWILKLEADRHTELMGSLDKLLQSHAALEQKMEAMHRDICTAKAHSESTITLAENNEKWLQGLDARLNGTGDAISLLLEDRFATLDQQIAYILHDLLADLRKAEKPARRKKAKK